MCPYRYYFYCTDWCNLSHWINIRPAGVPVNFFFCPQLSIQRQHFLTNISEFHSYQFINLLSISISTFLPMVWQRCDIFEIGWIGYNVAPILTQHWRWALYYNIVAVLPQLWYNFVETLLRCWKIRYFYVGTMLKSVLYHGIHTTFRQRCVNIVWMLVSKQTTTFKQCCGLTKVSGYNSFQCCYNIGGTAKN